MKRSLLLAAICASVALSQPGPKAEPGKSVTFHRETFQYVAGEAGLGGKVVKGLPYSADAVTETTQQLVDGNRISRQNTAQIWRDSEGRTRREETLNAIGPWASAGDPAKVVFINDPVAGVSYVLEPRDHTARKLQIPELKVKAAAGMLAVAPAGLATAGPVLPNVMIHRESVEDKSNSKEESLGVQSIEGIAAEGTRTTITIPAGAIGNEQPILIVSERWYSPDLQAVVKTKHSDPRMSETVYRLTNIQRIEPPQSLFVPPSDYTIQEGKPQVFQYEKRPGNEPRP